MNRAMSRKVYLWHHFPNSNEYAQLCNLTAVEDTEGVIHVVFNTEQVFQFAEIIGDALPVPDYPAPDFASVIEFPALFKQEPQPSQEAVPVDEAPVEEEKPKPRRRKKKEAVNGSSGDSEEAEG